jgi:hypothetical protein
MDDGVARALHKSAESKQGLQVLEWADLSDEGRLDGKRDATRTDLLDQAALGTGLRPADDIYSVPSTVEQRRREHRGLLGPTDDEAGDDMEYADSPIIHR